MATLLTGSTGFLGSYLAAGLLGKGEPVAVLVRARDLPDAERRLWHAWQLHLDWDAFDEHRRKRLEIFVGDLTEPGFGLSPDDHHRLVADLFMVPAADCHCRHDQQAGPANQQAAPELVAEVFPVPTPGDQSARGPGQQ